MSGRRRLSAAPKYREMLRLLGRRCNELQVTILMIWPMYEIKAI